MNGSKYLAGAAILSGGLAFVGSANAANLVNDPSFQGDATAAGPWGAYTVYAQTYGGIQGPDLDLTDDNGLTYGFNDNISINADDSFHGLSFPGDNSQTLALVNGDLSAGQIAAGLGRFSFSTWMSACCNDMPALTATFDTGEVFTLDRGLIANQVTTADKLENPGGAENVLSETTRGYWALYEVQGVINSAATSVTISIDEGTNSTSNDNDLYADIVVFDAVAVPEPGSLALLGLGGLAMLRRRRA